MDDDVKRLLETMRQENAVAHADTRRHFDVFAEDFRHSIGIVAEGLQHSIEVVAEGVRINTERIEHLSAEMKEEFADIRSIIKFWH